ncbi:MAG: alpha-amylase family glycosyl hydrolase [Kiritimatiellia bacterium]
MKTMKSFAALFILCILSVLAIPASAEVMLQWFETEWDEMYLRTPEVAEAGYSYIWMPPPTKAPTGLGTKWGNVGYSLYDRFDLGDVPQRGSLATRYGTRGSLRNMVDQMHQCDVKIIPDIVMNHNGNGPDHREYPGMRATDFHVWYQDGYCNSLDYKRADRMDSWTPDNGYGATMYQDLCSLIDIRTEDCTLTRGWGTDNRFTTPNGPSYIAGESFLRHVGQYDRYPYYPSGYGNEEVSDMLYRWIAWLGDAMDYDGLRLDAGKHTPWEFFGDDETGFLHEAQYNQSLRRGYTNFNDNTDVFVNDINRKRGLIFAEILSGWSEITYWANNNPMRFLDYAIKKTADGALNGNIGAFYGSGTDFGPANGIMYIWGHDEGPASKVDLGYAYTLTHIGIPMVYFTGKNITWDDKNTGKTWMVPGYDDYALGDNGSKIPNLVWINAHFGWGREWNRWADSDFLALERFDDLNSNSNPDSGEGMLLAAFNDAGYDITKSLDTVFTNGTVLHDYTGNNPSDVTVSGGKASITVPGNYGQGWVCYAPLTPNVTISIPGTNGMAWNVPGGIHGTDKLRTIPRITSSSFTVNANLSATPADVLLKWGNGTTQVGSGTHYTNDSLLVRANFEQMGGSGTSWSLSITNAASKIPEGLNTVKVRAYVNTPGSGRPALYNTSTKVVYVDLNGPELDITWPAAGATVQGEGVMTIENPDYTAYGMTVSIDGGAADSAHEIMKGLWKYNLSGLSAGTHTARVTTTEADWGVSRQVINTSIYDRVFTVAANANSIGLSCSEGSTNKLPFFTTSVNAPGASNVRLYWDGYELPLNAGLFTNTFNGEIIQRDNIGNVVTNRLWGNFANGQHFFEAERVDAGVTSRVSRRVVFNLYGINAIDSDGDSLPDNLEMPFIDTVGAPGANVPWPGDSNQNFIPESWETWTRLNPYNHSTFYSGQWDDQNDMDGDGYNNYAELYAGYVESNNIYAYNIYDSNSKPSGTPTVPAEVTYSPDPALRTNNITITYKQNEGPLETATNLNLHVGHSKRTLGEWQDTQSIPMTWDGGNSRYTANYMVPSNATSVDFCFNDGTTWDNNGGSDWQATVQGTTSGSFTMDGNFDGANSGDGYTVLGYDMKILAAVKGSDLYVATWGAGGGGNDHYLYVSPSLGDASDPAPGWSKSGLAFFDTANEPFMAAEGDNGWHTWYNASGTISNKNGGALEGVINLLDTFGYIPEYVYVASVAFGSADGSGVASQTPHVWDTGNNMDIMEFQRVAIDSIRDENDDGYFDAGQPELYTVTSGTTNDANYGLIRFFLNELAGEEEEITIVFKPNAGTGNTVTDVELFSNLNRRDFAVLPGDEDPDSVTTTSGTTYFRAYPMTSSDGGITYTATLKVSKCGAYRINARCKINGSAYHYYTDNGLRRDCAVVVSPKKALQNVMYELNPMFAEATNANFYGRSTFADMYQVNTDRPNRISTNVLQDLGINMIWLQPIHPIGTEGREIDPNTGTYYDPGSPYAVRNYWKVNSVLGDPATDDQAMSEFTNFVQAMDASGIGVMLDGTFNHSAWDCEAGQPAVDMFGFSSASAYIRDAKPAWYAKENHYGQMATYYGSMSTKDIAPAPDRIDFGKWYDAAEFHFGNYDCLVQEAPADTNWAWSSEWYNRYLFEYDKLEPLSNATRQLWQYFAYYPAYWLEKTGHPEGTGKSDSYKGIDGLRCDFAQGLPSEFWEYCINKTRSVKWDFLFMAESLDGYRTVNSDKHHGVGYRSARHFDILNENLVYYWRDNFFAEYTGGSTNKGTPNRTTSPTQTQFDNRKDAFRNVPLLLNLTSHDDIYSTYHQPSIMHAYAEVAAMGGVPMIMYGQEAGAQNHYATYNRGGEIDAANNFAYYESNFGKSIVNFKRYNCMTSIWSQGEAYMGSLRETYGKISRARQNSPALRSQNDYFLSTTAGGKDESIFAVAKYEAAGVSAATQDVVLVFVNNDCQSTNVRSNVYTLNASVFGIEDGKYYNVVNLLGSNPTNLIWSAPGLLGSVIKTNFFVSLNGDLWADNEWQIQYLKLIDTTATYPKDGDGLYAGSTYSTWDSDGDGLPDSWESGYGLDPNSATTTNGAAGDPDNDGMPNEDELLAGTDPTIDDALTVNIDIAGSGVDVWWPSITDINYRLQATDALIGGADWQNIYFGTALSTTSIVTDSTSGSVTTRYYRAVVVP